MKKIMFFNLVFFLFILGCSKPYVGDYLNPNIPSHSIGYCYSHGCNRVKTYDNTFNFITTINNIKSNKYEFHVIVRIKEKTAFNRIVEGNFVMYLIDNNVIIDRFVIGSIKSFINDDINDPIELNRKFETKTCFDSFLIDYNLKTATI